MDNTETVFYTLFCFTHAWLFSLTTNAVKDLYVLGGIWLVELPHQPWQRGTNENSNSLLREHFPKGRGITPFSETQIQEVVDKLNCRPPKCLN